MKKVAYFLRSPRWSGVEGMWVWGRPLYRRTFLDPDQLRELLSKSIVQGRIDPALLKAILGELRGHFAIVWHASRQLVLAADIVRTYPLFYTTALSEIAVSDHLPNPSTSSLRLSNRDLLEFAMTGFVTGPETMYEDVWQVQAGEVVILDLLSDEAEGHTYFSFSPLHPKRIDDVHAKDRYVKIVDELVQLSVERLIRYLDGRTAVVPLSGGWDSRTILLQLLRLGYDNVLTFSYGKEGNKESQVSREVAQKLGVRWKFIPYTVQKWRDFAQTKEYRDYLGYAHNAVSVPHIQDLLAIHEMLKQGVISPDDSVIVPGHSADFVAGSHLQVAHSRIRDVNTFVKALMGKHYILNTPRVIFDWLSDLFEWQNDEELFFQLRNKLVKQVEVLHSESPFVDPHALLDSWNWRERQAKFIVNSVRVYDYYRLDFWMPLWDLDFIGVWQSVPLEYRLRRSLYQEYLAHLQEDMRLDAQVIGHAQALRKQLSSTIEVYHIKSIILAALNLGKTARSVYNGHPMQWYGIWEHPEFTRLFNVNLRRLNINSLLVLDVLGRCYNDENC